MIEPFADSYVALEKHFTVQQVVEPWGLSDDTVRRV